MGSKQIKKGVGTTDPIRSVGRRVPLSISKDRGQRHSAKSNMTDSYLIINLIKNGLHIQFKIP